jgi:hypothetical protein
MKVTMNMIKIKNVNYTGEYRKPLKGENFIKSGVAYLAHRDIESEYPIVKVIK